MASSFSSYNQTPEKPDHQSIALVGEDKNLNQKSGSYEKVLIEFEGQYHSRESSTTPSELCFHFLFWDPFFDFVFLDIC